MKQFPHKIIIAFATVVVLLLIPLAKAYAVPIDFFHSPIADVDKKYTGGEDAIGGFLAIDPDEINRCWQAVFANILYGFGLTTDAEKTYYDNFARWGNDLATVNQQKTFFDAYFSDKNLPYYASAYEDLSKVNFAFAADQLFLGQGVKLGVGDSQGAFHAITFWGWNYYEESAPGLTWLADSDGDYLGGTPATLWSNSTDANGYWHLELMDGSTKVKDYTVWNIVTVCPVPEPSTLALVGIALILYCGSRNRHRLHKSADEALDLRDPAL